MNTSCASLIQFVTTAVMYYSCHDNTAIELQSLEIILWLKNEDWTSAWIMFNRVIVIWPWKNSKTMSRDSLKVSSQLRCLDNHLLHFSLFFILNSMFLSSKTIWPLVTMTHVLNIIMAKAQQPHEIDSWKTGKEGQIQKNSSEVICCCLLI